MLYLFLIKSFPNGRKMTDSNESIAKRLRPNRQGTVTPLQVSSVTSKNSMSKLYDKFLQKPFAHLDIETKKRMCAKSLECKNSVFRHVLCKFDHFITSIDACDAHFKDNQWIDINAIAHKQYGLKQLKELSLKQATIDCDKIKPIFVRLVKLILNICKFTGNETVLFANCPELENLSFDSCDSSNFTAQKLLKLIGLSFDCFLCASFTFFKLLEKNPQIHLRKVWNDCAMCNRLGFMSATPEVQTK